jgi:hypothetical protein
VRGENPARDTLPASSYGERTLTASRGLSTGPTTREGIERIKEANTKHGRYRKAARESRRRVRSILREAIAGMRAVYKKPPRV